MSTPAQIAANIANAQASTGPTSERGKATSAQNGITFGLFAAGDFVRPDESAEHEALRRDLLRELAPQGVLECHLVEEIGRALWRLRRCGQVEANLVLRLDDNPIHIMDPMESGSANALRIQNSVDRARSQAHRLLHKCTAELRKLQAERGNGTDGNAAVPAIPRMTIQTQSEPAVVTQTPHNVIQMPRNARCQCNSGLKYKRCCGRTAPGSIAGRASRSLSAA